MAENMQMSTLNVLTSHMHATYRGWYGGDEPLRQLRSLKDEHVLVRHIVRTRLGRLYEAGPSMVGRAEGRLRGGGAVNHATIINSMRIFDGYLAAYEPELVGRVDAAIAEADVRGGN